MLEPLVVSLYPKYLLNHTHTHTHTQRQTLKLGHRAYLSTERWISYTGKEAQTKGNWSIIDWTNAQAL